jgi:transposase-like protein
MTRIDRRDPVKEQFWRDTVAAYEQSGLTVRAFCADRDISEERFFTWRRDLRLRDREGASPTPPPAVPSFVPVRIVADPTAEVTLPTGVVVRVPVHADPAAVARLVAALGIGPC